MQAVTTVIVHHSLRLPNAKDGKPGSLYFTGLTVMDQSSVEFAPGQCVV